MNGESERKIEVKPSTLANLIADVGSGKYRIPQFQREYVWSKAKVRELFDSIYQEFPIGSFFIWVAGREHNRLFRHLVSLPIPPIREHDDVSFILDGQQRITSLFITLKGLSMNGFDYRSIVFDLKEQTFKDRQPDNNRYVSVSDIWGPNSLILSRKIHSDFVAAYERCWRVLQTYPVSIVEVRDKELPAVCKIFQRINQGGQRLSRFDLVSAMTYTPDFDLRSRFKADVLDRLEQKAFGPIAPAIMTQLLSLVKFGLCTERYEFSLTTDDIKEHWRRCVESLLLAADALRQNMGVVNYAYLPYGAFLTLLAYYFSKSDNHSLPPEHMEWVKHWFWRASFSQHYGSAGPTKIGQDKKLFDELIAGTTPTFNVQVRLTVQELVKTRMTWTGSAIRNAFLCLLATRKPLHLVNNSPLDLVNGGISDFTSDEKHHIFPRAFLNREGPENAEIHALPNFCFLPAELNRRILDTEPSEYIKAFRQENPEFEKAARSHLLPFGSGSGIDTNDYLRFLKARGDFIIEEIGRLSGEVSTPRQEERQRAIEDTEHAIRDCICLTLRTNAGEQFWKTNIPPAVRENAEKRIRETLSKHSDMTPQDFADTRAKLNFVNVMDYRTIVENGGNWTFFEPIFRRKQDLQNHLESFSEYRNAVMHSRPITELVKMKGETAMIWIRSVLPAVEVIDTSEGSDNG